MLFPTWKDWLLTRTSEAGSWLSETKGKAGDCLDGRTKLSADAFALAVAAAQGDGVVLVADQEGQVSLFHNLTLAEVDGKFSVIGALGMRSALTLAELPPEARSKKISGRNILVPTIVDMAKTSSSEELRNLKPVAEDPVASENEVAAADTDVSGVTNSFWLHPKWLPLVEESTFAAADLASKIVAGKNPAGADVERTDVEAEEASMLVTWLWLVSRKQVKPGQTLRLPDTEEVDKIFQKVQAKRAPSPQQEVGAQGASPEKDGLTGTTGASLRDALDSMAKVHEKMLERQVQDADRKRMTHRLTREGVELFKLLSATSWRDPDPSLNPFTEKLLSDKDAGKGLLLLQGEIERQGMRCEVSSTCLVQFFAQGWCPRDFDRVPSGFTLLMFRPLSATAPANTNEREVAIRSAFGKHALEETGIKAFSKSDLYVPPSLRDLESMMESCIQFLDMITAANSIASDGYREGLKLIGRYARPLNRRAESTPGFWLRLAFFFDQVFQNFATDLMSRAAEEDEEAVLPRMASSMKRQMSEDISDVLLSARYGVVPDLPLPTSLSAAGKTKVATKKEHATPNQEKAHAPSWWTRNQNPVASWCIPAGKKYGDFFDPTDERKAAWSRDWPKVTHHATGKLAKMCPRYQVTGVCKSKCALAHIDPKSLSREVHDNISSKVSGAYA